MFENSYKIRVSSRAIVIEGDHLLLTEFGDGQYYNFTGGGIEEGETAKQAVIREVLEESGLTVEVGELVFSLEYEPASSEYSYGKDHHISFFFRCYVDKSAPAQAPSNPDCDPDDATITSTVKWVPIAELKNITMVPAIAEPLLRYIESGMFSPSFWEESEQRK